MSLRTRLVVLTTAGLLAAGYTAAMAFEPLCSVFRSARHYGGRSAPAHTAQPATSTPATLADHR